MPTSKASSANTLRRKLVLQAYWALFFSLFIIPVALARAPGTVTLSFSKEDVLEGQSTRVYANISSAVDDIRGVVKFFDAGKQIGPDQPFTVIKGRGADVFTDYGKLPYGERSIEARFVTFSSKDAPFVAKKVLFVDRDSDKDALPDRKDPDDDNDTVVDEQDAFPLDPKESVDTDSDKLGDKADPDDDNDGIPDEIESQGPTDPKKADTDGDGVKDGEDGFPMDPKESVDHDRDGIGDSADGDDDGDGVADTEDELPLDATGSKDADRDGVGDETDQDLDGDGITNAREKEIGTDATNPDTDGDSMPDGQDGFPLDTNETTDSDHDGLGDAADPDDANRGPVIQASFPERATLFFPYWFSSLGTTDPDGTIRSVSWIVDGNRIEKESFRYFFVIPGPHSVLIEATDDKGETRTLRRDVTVSPAAYLLVLVLGSGAYWYRIRQRRTR